MDRKNRHALKRYLVDPSAAFDAVIEKMNTGMEVRRQRLKSSVVTSEKCFVVAGRRRKILPRCQEWTLYIRQPYADADLARRVSHQAYT